MNKRVVLKLVSLFFLSLFAIFIGLIFANKNYINKVSIKEFSNDDVSLDVEIKSTIPFISGSKYCLLTNSEKIPSINDDNWVMAKNDVCHLSSSKDNNYLYIKDIWGNISNLDKDDQVIKKVFDVGFKYEYYMYKGMTLDLNDVKNYYVLNNSASYDYDEKVISIDDGLIKAIGSGETTLSLKGYEDSKKIRIVVTDAVGQAVLDDEKPYITCGQFSYEEAKLLDEILASKVKDAGEGSRAAVLAVARFITLEFKYRIPYFYENGRLNNYDPYQHVDGEGRYYHKGLFLHESKFDDLDSNLVGPATWGCDLQNFTNWGPYIYGNYYPNGLDCSGFVSWALYNAGFDMGDIGAGIDNDHLDYTDLGELVYLSDELLNSGKIKVGDLIGLNGHIAIIAGMDENNIYIAESLNTTGGVVMTVVPLTSLVHNSIYEYVILMDGYYNNDGDYTNMW